MMSRTSSCSTGFSRGRKRKRLKTNAPWTMRTGANRTLVCMKARFRKIFLRIVAVLAMGCLPVAFFASGSTIVYVPAKILLSGEGGILRRAGKVEASLDGEKLIYDAYLGHARDACGHDLDEMLLIADGAVPESGGLCKNVFIGRDYVSFPNGLRHFKLPFGLLPMTYLGKVDCDKVLGGTCVLYVTEDPETHDRMVELHFEPRATSTAAVRFSIPAEYWRCAFPHSRDERDEQTDGRPDADIPKAVTPIP